MNEFNKRRRNYLWAQEYRRLAEAAYDPEQRDQYRALAEQYQRRGQGFGTLKGKNRRGMR